jgi:ribosomal protein S27E
MDGEEIIGTALPHSEFGDPECCGCLNGFVRGDHADIICNECSTVVRMVPAGGLQRTLDEMNYLF